MPSTGLEAAALEARKPTVKIVRKKAAAAAPTKVQAVMETRKANPASQVFMAQKARGRTEKLSCNIFHRLNVIISGDRR
jgi:hypothetical protein